MGKKNKNNQIDYFNMTPEEQMANAEMFNDYEKGKISFLDDLNYKVPTAPVRQSDYKKQIERACLGIIDNDDDDKVYDNEITTLLNKRESHDDEGDIEGNDESNDYIPYSSIINDNEKLDNKSDEVVISITEPTATITASKAESDVKMIFDNIPRICFAYNNIIGKMMIDDGYVTTPVSICHTSSIELNEDNIPKDSDAFATLLSKIFFFIISCKHPAVIMSENTFEIEFSMFSKLNFNKFIFFKNKGFVYAYVLDSDETDNFYSVAEIFNMDDDSVLRYVIGTAFASNTMHNIFMYNDEDEVESVMEARHSVKELIKLIDNDPDTEYAGHNSAGNVMTRMRVTDLQTFVSDVYGILEDLIETEDEEEDDDDENPYDISDCEDSNEDEEEVNNEEYDDIDINVFPDDDNNTSDTEDINSMMDDIESSDDNEEDDSGTNTDKITLPKIYRRS